MDEVKENEQEKLFTRASEYTPDERMLAQDNFKGFFQWVLEVSKANAPENNGISVKASMGVFGAEITYSPPIIRYSRGGRQDTHTRARGQDTPKTKASKTDMESIVSEYPDYLSLTETDKAYIIKTNKFMGDLWKPIMRKIDGYGGSWTFPEGEEKKAWVIPK